MGDLLRAVFDSIHAEEELKTKTKHFLHRRLYETRKRRMYSISCAAACSLLLMVGAGGYSFYYTPVTYISIDINPSIEFELNRLDRIIAVTPYNQDGAKAVENLALKNMKYDDAIVTLLESEPLSAYLGGNTQISISVATDLEEKNAEVRERVMECTRSQDGAGNQYGAVSCHSASGEDMKTAHHEGVSFGKYRAFQELQALDPEISLEDVKGMSMHQIQKLIDKYKDGSGSSAEDGGHDDSCGSSGVTNHRHGHGS